MSLSQFEKSQRKLYTLPPDPVSVKEILYCSLICFFAAPFLYSALFMIAFIGQGLFMAAFLLTLTYFYVRRSFKLFLAGCFSNLLFIVPTMVTMHAVTVKNRFDVTLFFLMATCIPVSVFYILLTAGMVWYRIEKRQVEVTPERGNSLRAPGFGARS